MIKILKKNFLFKKKFKEDKSVEDFSISENLFFKEEGIYIYDFKTFCKWIKAAEPTEIEGIEYPTNFEEQRMINDVESADNEELRDAYEKAKTYLYAWKIPDGDDIILEYGDNPPFEENFEEYKENTVAESSLSSKKIEEYIKNRKLLKHIGFQEDGLIEDSLSLDFDFKKVINNKEYKYTVCLIYFDLDNQSFDWNNIDNIWVTVDDYNDLNNSTDFRLSIKNDFNTIKELVRLFDKTDSIKPFELLSKLSKSNSSSNDFILFK